MEYILVSESVINAFVTTIQKVCGISSPIKISYIPQLLEQFETNKNDFVDSFMSGSLINAKVLTNISYIRPYAFYAYGDKMYADFTAVKQIGEYAFYKCSKPLVLGFPVLNTIGSCAFLDCVSLSSIKFPEVQYIGQSAFQGCTSLKSVYLTTDTVPVLANSNAFLNTKIMDTGKIFVRESLVPAFKNSDQWSFFSDHIAKV